MKLLLELERGVIKRIEERNMGIKWQRGLLSRCDRYRILIYTTDMWLE